MHGYILIRNLLKDLFCLSGHIYGYNGIIVFYNSYGIKRDQISLSLDFFFPTHYLILHFAVFFLFTRLALF